MSTGPENSQHSDSEPVPPQHPAWEPPASPTPGTQPGYGQQPGGQPPSQQPGQPASRQLGQPWGQPPGGDAPFGAPGQGWGQPAVPAWAQLPPGQYQPQFQGYVAPPKPGVIPLRPLGLGEILDGAFQACRKNPAATFGTAVIFQVIIALIAFLFTGNALASAGELNALLSAPGAPTAADAQELMSLGLSMAAAGTVLGLLSSIGVLVLQGLLVIPVARAILNRKTGFAKMWRLAKGRIWPLVGLGALLLAMIVAASVLVLVVVVLLAVWLGNSSVLPIVLTVLGFAVLFIWVAVKLVLAPAVLVLEGAGVFTSLKRSWLLTSRSWWRVFGILLLTSLIVSIISSVITAPVTFVATALSSLGAGGTDPTATLAAGVPAMIIASLISTVFGAIGYAFQAAVTSLLYVDLRIRREGFDMVLLKEHELAGGGDPDGVPGRGPAPFQPAGSRQTAPWPPGGPYQGGPYQPGPYPGGPYQGGPYQPGPYPGGPYPGGPWPPAGPDRSGQP